MNKFLMKKYYDKRSQCQVLGVLMKQPKLIKSKDFPLEKIDFIGGVHQVVYTCVYNLAYQGVKQITLSDIETYLANTSPTDYKKVFEKFNGSQWITDIIADANELNFNYYYNVVKKMALLRSYLEQGVEVKEILDLEEVNPSIIKEQRDAFDKMTIEEIIKMLDKKILKAKKRFIVNGGVDRKRAGEGAKEYRKKLKENPPYGLSFESEYLNTIFRGANRKKFLIETRPTGVGKSRTGIGRVSKFCANYIWSHKYNDFVPNPNGENNGGLYIGTEMELLEEIEPILWATVSGVDEQKIMENTTTKEEDARIDKAIEIIKKSNMHLIKDADFDIESLEQYIEEYKIDYNIGYVFFDYIMITNSLISCANQISGGMRLREDQILLNLSDNLKRMTNDYDIFLQSATQVSGDWKNIENKDQTIIRGSKAIIDKCDQAMISMPPVKKELEKIEPIIRELGLVKHKYPNLVHTIYKNRGGSINGVKVWGYQDLGNMEWIDMFCTTKDDYKLINVNPTNIKVVNNKTIITM